MLMPQNGLVGVPRIYSLNLLHHLRDRERGYFRQHHIHRMLPNHEYFERKTLKCIAPNLSIQNVDKPLGYIRKFTPDGKLLLGFSQNQRCLEIFEFQGVYSALDLFENQSTECISASDDNCESLAIRQEIFERLFHLKKAICVEPDVAQCLLNREFSIFMERGHYVLVAATMPADTALLTSSDLLSFADLYDDCEFFRYFFYLIDLEENRVIDTIVYQNDCIILSHNHGVSVYGRMIAILSKYRQNIDLFELVDGKIIKLTSIGDFRDERDVSLYMRLGENRTSIFGSINILPLPFLKQKILSHLYGCILNSELDQMEKRNRIRKFYEDYNIIEHMLLSKIQLIDEQNMLLRYEEREDYCGPNRKKSHTDFKLYVFFCLSEGEVLKIFRKDSVELLHLLRDCSDHFRNVRSLHTGRSSSSPSNNVNCREMFNNAIKQVPGGENGAAIRFNQTLPISAQSFSTTQYLDYSLFDYDDRLISSLERPKLCSLEPIRFIDRNTNMVIFRIYLESPLLRIGNNNNSSATNTSRELVAFVFHPFEPFLISIQKISSRYVVNFHIYNRKTFVER